MSSIDDANSPKEVVRNFATETTMHGLKFLFARGVFRNAIWLLLLLGSCVLVFVQVRQQLSKYLAHEISTQIDFNYPSSLPFPSVMICNSNMYRISKIYQYVQLYDMTVDIWNRKHSSDRLTPPDFTQYATILSNLTKTFKNDAGLFMKAFGHSITDMLLNCLAPDGSLCTSKDFEVQMTDIGPCYVFNKTMDVTIAGAVSSLTLYLNIQEYEAMPGPSTLSSIKVLVFDAEDSPDPAKEAIDIAPGYMSMIGLKYTQEKRITSCVDQRATKHFSEHQYTSASCTIDAIYSGIEKSCNCSPHYAPRTEVPVCKIEEYLDCVLFYDPTNVTQDLMNCNESCSLDDYVTSLSMAKISSGVMSKLQEQFNSAMLTDFTNAMEATTRKDTTYLSKMKAILDYVQSATNQSETFGFWPNVLNVEPLCDKLKAHSSSYKNFSETFSLLISKSNPSGPPGPPDPPGSYNGNPVNESNLMNGYKFVLSAQQKAIFEEDYDENINLVLSVFDGWQLWQRLLYNPSQAVYQMGKFNGFIDLMNDMDGYSKTEKTKRDWALNEPKYATFPSDYTVRCLDYISTVQHFVADLQSLVTDNLTQQIFYHLNETDIENSPFWLSVNYGSTAQFQYPIETSGCSSDSNANSFVSCFENEDSSSVQCCATIQSSNYFYWSFFKSLEQNLNNLIGETKQFVKLAEKVCDDVHQSFSKLNSDLESYSDKWNWGYDFYSTNFLGITIYLSEISQQIITQSQPYDFFSLICDIGGSLGLFLGASILTFFEIVDMIIFGICSHKNSIRTQ